MKFDELDAQMRVFERDAAPFPARDWLVARLDGRGFTRLTKENLDLAKPFDARFHDAMSATLAHLFDCGFAVRLGFSQSDEISLLFEPNGSAFERKTRKWLSVLAGEASAKMSLQLQKIAVFDCRLIGLPDKNRALDYFRWRQSDANRNALSAHCYWILRAQNHSARAAESYLNGLSSEAKTQFLAQNGVDFSTLPRWQTRGFAAFWSTFQKSALNPKTGETVQATRKQLQFERELPNGESFAAWLEAKIA